MQKIGTNRFKLIGVLIGMVALSQVAILAAVFLGSDAAKIAAIASAAPTTFAAAIIGQLLGKDDNDEG